MTKEKFAEKLEDDRKAAKDRKEKELRDDFMYYYINLINIYERIHSLTRRFSATDSPGEMSGRC
eukprot:SAG31_NODE_34918_length_328_cov_0.593886_1_plen_64_part_00